MYAFDKLIYTFSKIKLSRALICAVLKKVRRSSVFFLPGEKKVLGTTYFPSLERRKMEATYFPSLERRKVASVPQMTFSASISLSMNTGKFLISLPTKTNSYKD